MITWDMNIFETNCVNNNVLKLYIQYVKKKNIYIYSMSNRRRAGLGRKSKKLMLHVTEILSILRVLYGHKVLSTHSGLDDVVRVTFL